MLPSFPMSSLMRKPSPAPPPPEKFEFDGVGEETRELRAESKMLCCCSVDFSHIKQSCGEEFRARFGSLNAQLSIADEEDGVSKCTAISGGGGSAVFMNSSFSILDRFLKVWDPKILVRSWMAQKVNSKFTSERLECCRREEERKW